ncbi:hypothetical protein [Geminocystis sp.]|uniref:hypothetical protein n=1 Tax=Geminocystis sp. TaxID=2664100 RepID=UPI00359460BC
MNKNIESELVTPKEIQKLYQLTIYGRWILVCLSWILILPWGLWELRETISLCQEYCTWSGIRLGLEFNPWAALGLSFCIVFTTSVLVWQSSYILRGDFSEKQKYYLTQKVTQIRQKGKKYWLYSFVCEDNN